MREDGFALVEDVLQQHSLRGFNKQDIRVVVETNDKKRFTLLEENSKLYIRANQGHSLQVPRTLSLNPFLIGPVN